MIHLDKNRVVVAMSGGVDSSVAALLLKQAGYEVIGVSMKTHDEVEENALPVARHAAKNCCSVEDIQDARTICHQLDIPFYAMNFKETFKAEVIDYFAREYHRGRTPNPCVKCNDLLKFKSLLKETRALGAYYLATGHYVRKEQAPGGAWRLLRGQDKQKDQSYFLFGLGQEQLEHLLFPIGHLTKDEVRHLAHDAGMKTAEKAESQEICFVPNNNYKSVLEKRYPELKSPLGSFVSQDGTELGTHEGIQSYTIGQRRGLGIAAGKRVYVTHIDAPTNRVVLGDDADLYHKTAEAGELSWVQGLPDLGAVKIVAKIRYRHGPVAARVTLKKGNRAAVDFDVPQRAITPGQAIAFYCGDELLGGGWIEQVLN